MLCLQMIFPYLTMEKPKDQHKTIETEKNIAKSYRTQHQHAMPKYSYSQEQNSKEKNY